MSIKMTSQMKQRQENLLRRLANPREDYPIYLGGISLKSLSTGVSTLGEEEVVRSSSIPDFLTDLKIIGKLTMKRWFTRLLTYR